MFAEMTRDLERMNQFMTSRDVWDAMASSPAIDMREGKSAYVVVVSLPGLSREDVLVTLDNRILTVLAPPDGLFAGSHCRRRLRLPGPVSGGDAARATFTNGILRVMVPKQGGEVGGESMRRLL